jgi:hypothetical protein
MFGAREHMAELAWPLPRAWPSISLGSMRATVGKEADAPWTFSGLAMQTAMMSIGPVQKQRTSVVGTAVIKDGMLLTVDGSRGVVRIDSRV